VIVTIPPALLKLRLHLIRLRYKLSGGSKITV
jgi:hypothetical protein